LRAHCELALVSIHLPPENFQVLLHAVVSWFVLQSARKPTICYRQIASDTVAGGIHRSKRALRQGIVVAGCRSQAPAGAIAISGNAVSVKIFLAVGYKPIIATGGSWFGHRLGLRFTSARGWNRSGSFCVFLICARTILGWRFLVTVSCLRRGSFRSSGGRFFRLSWFRRRRLPFIIRNNHV